MLHKQFYDKLLNPDITTYAIGQELNNFFYEELKIKSDKLGILTDNKMKTSSPNVYAVGDSVSKDVYQVVTAVSEGAIAASDIIRKIKSK